MVQTVLLSDQISQTRWKNESVESSIRTVSPAPTYLKIEFEFKSEINTAIVNLHVMSYTFVPIQLKNMYFHRISSIFSLIKKCAWV